MPHAALRRREKKRRILEQHKQMQQQQMGTITKTMKATPQNTHSTHHPITSA